MMTLAARPLATTPAARHVEVPIAAAIVAIAIALLMLAIPVMASVPVPAGGQPRPMPAPAPAVSAAADFPEQARPAAACEAILTRSSAVDNRRSQQAASITTALLEDACLGA